MMKFNVIRHITDTTKDEWLNDVEVSTLEELKEAVKKLQDEYKVEIEVDILGETIYIGFQCWIDF